jgi:hypothetical protein
MIAVLHVAFVWAVGISNVKQLLTSLVPWYVSAREDCYTVCHVDVNSKKNSRYSNFLLQPSLKVLLPKYPCIQGHGDRPQYRVSVDGICIVVSFILTRYMYNEIGHDGNTIARYMLAIQHIPCSSRTWTPLVRDHNTNATERQTDRQHFKITLITITHQGPYQPLPYKCLLPVVWECERHAGRN